MDMKLDDTKKSLIEKLAKSVKKIEDPIEQAYVLGLADGMAKRELSIKFELKKDSDEDEGSGEN